MPYISSTTSVLISKTQRENLKTKLAQAVQKIAGKGENWLMLSFQDGQEMYFQGQTGDKLALIELKLVGGLSAIQKKELAAEIGQIYQDEIGIPANNNYLIITEVSGTNWGWNKGTFS